MDKNMNSKYQGNIRQLLMLVIPVTIIFILLIIVFTPKKEKEIVADTNKIEIQEIGDGFLYYDGDIYYKNLDMVILSDDYVGEMIGTNEWQIKYDDIEDNKIDTGEKNICVYATLPETEVYKYELRDDILLVKTDYALFGYFVYIKNQPKSSFDDRASLKYYIDNPDVVTNYRLISYNMRDIDIEYQLSDFTYDPNNTFSFASSSVDKGGMQYYLLIECDNLYSAFIGEGNILSDVILITSVDDGKEVNYMYKHDKLSDILIEMYADFFDINKDVANLYKDYLEEQNSEEDEKTEAESESKVPDKEPDNLNEYKGKTQDELIPLN